MTFVAYVKGYPGDLNREIDEIGGKSIEKIGFRYFYHFDRGEDRDFLDSNLMCRMFRNLGIPTQKHDEGRTFVLITPVGPDEVLKRARLPGADLLFFSSYQRGSIFRRTKSRGRQCDSIAMTRTVIRWLTKVLDPDFYTDKREFIFESIDEFFPRRVSGLKPQRLITYHGLPLVQVTYSENQVTYSNGVMNVAAVVGDEISEFFSMENKSNLRSKNQGGKV